MDFLIMVLDLLFVTGGPFIIVLVVGEIDIQFVFSHWGWSWAGGWVGVWEYIYIIRYVYII